MSKLTAFIWNSVHLLSDTYSRLLCSSTLNICGKKSIRLYLNKRAVKQQVLRACSSQKCPSVTTVLDHTRFNNVVEGVVNRALTPQLFVCLYIIWFNLESFNL